MNEQAADDRISLEHQLRYEMARANMYKKAYEGLKRLFADAILDSAGLLKYQEERLKRDWSKVDEAHLIQMDKKPKGDAA